MTTSGLPSSARSWRALLCTAGIRGPLDQRWPCRPISGRRRPGPGDRRSPRPRLCPTRPPPGEPTARSSMRRPCTWNPTRSAPSSPSSIGLRHGSWRNSSWGGNGMCKKNPMRRSGRTAPEHLRNQLQMVVMHPDSRSRRRGVRHGTRVAVVDRHVGVPPLPVERRGANRVVIQRPQRRVGEPDIKLLELGIVEGHGAQLDALMLRWHGRLRADARPPDPHTRPASQHRRQCRHQAARAQVPMHPTLAFDSPDGQPVSYHDQLGAPWPRGSPHGHRPPHPAHPRCPPQNPTRARQTAPRRAESLLRASLNSPSTAGRPTRTQ